MPSQTPATLPNSAGNSDNNTEQKAPQCLVREQDRYMPIANVIRIMRKILPPHAKISDDAKETMQECVSEYIAFITGEANERCQREQRKTVTAEDVLWAMGKLGFDNYVEPLTIYLQRYRESESSDRSQFVTREEPQLMDHCPPGHAGPQVAMMPPPPPSYGPENYFGPQHGPPMYDPSMMGMFRDGSSSGAGGGGSSSTSGAQVYLYVLAWLQSEFASFEFKDKLVPLDGIKSATVSPIEGQAAVNYIPELINARKIKEAVEDAGFPVSEFPQQDVAVCGLRIKGMACTSCSESVECALRMVDGVENVVVGLALEEAKVKTVASDKTGTLTVGKPVVVNAVMKCSSPIAQWRSSVLSLLPQRNYIINALDDSLYDVYSSYKTGKELWESLDKKYKSEVVSSKKFVIGKFLNYKMSDTKFVVKQVEELQVIVHELDEENLGLKEGFVVSSIIEKLPSNWKNFKIYLKHLTQNMSMDQLILKLRVEEDHRRNEKYDVSSLEAKANVVERGDSHKARHNQKNKGKDVTKKALTTVKGKTFKKIKGGCWVCGKTGHRVKDCRHKKDQNSENFNQANVAEDKFVAVVSEVNLLTNSNDWWVDTGATRHADRNLFVIYQSVDGGENMYMGNATASVVAGKGKVMLKLTSGKDLSLTNVLHVLDIRKNLISGSLMSNKGFKIVFESDNFVITKGEVYVGKGYLAEGLFKLNVLSADDINKNNKPSASSAYLIESSTLWHAKLGHVNFRSLQRMVNLGMLPKCSMNKVSKCEICTESKYARHSYKSVEKSNEILGLIYSDLCDFKSTPTRGGKNYYISFIDDCRKYCYVYLIHSKDEALNMFKTFKAEAENQLDKRIKVLRLDRGGEYESNDFAEFCSTHGIIHQTATPYTPQQNGVAERKNRTLKDMINSMLNSFGAPHNLWGEALFAANTILNRIPHKKSNQSPYEMWKGRLPTYKTLKVWGCLVKVQVPLPNRQKLGPKTVDCIFIGHANNSSAYGFLVHKSEIADIHVNTILESAEAEFFEEFFPYKDRSYVLNKRVHDDTTRNDDENHASTSRVQSQDLEPQKSKRAKIARDFGPDFLTFVTEEEPRTYKAALESSEAPYWKKAIQSEIESIMQNNTWELVNLPPGNKPIGHKWIFKRKLRPDGTIDKYKARLVAKGYRQKEGIDYFETYSPVARITSIRLLIAIASVYNLEIHQMNVKTAFLNGEIDEEIYMEQPKGFIVKGQEKKVCKLIKSLYGLKQAPKQ
ncbi:hypothetical protein C1H46_005724 [Malus baccata]|uniref:Integrase catalytic domain-containing protein n=1 Tax=Malus baccata TaxID=106549 RepID=A0A540NC64_MALBA|nr:hypothetical protein C1H46_005724 [Malus baccata]